MKRLIALLCTLCMIATMAPVAVMAEDAVVINSWDGSAAPTVADNGFEITPKTITALEFPTDVLSGNSGPYMQFTTVPDDVSKDEALLHTSGKFAFDTQYVAISLNVYGKALKDMYSRYSSNVKPYVAGDISTHLKDNIWNNVFVVFNDATKSADLYVNGKFISTQNFYTYIENLGKTEGVEVTVDRENNKWTYTKGDKSENGDIKLTDVRFKFVRHSANVYTWNIDDLAVFTSDSAIVPAEYATLTADGETIISDGMIKIKSETVKLSADKAMILVNGDEGNEAKAGDEVVVITYTPYGKIYSAPYMVSTMSDASVEIYTASELKKEFYLDGSNSKMADLNDRWRIANVNEDITADVTMPLGGKSDDGYLQFSGTGELNIYGANPYNTRYFALSINVYGQNLRDIWTRLADGSNKVSLVAEGNKIGGHLTNALTADVWNNVFLVFDINTKTTKTYVNGKYYKSADIFNSIEKALNGTVDREACTANANGTDIKPDYINLKNDIRFLFPTDKTISVDDIAVLTADYELTPAALAEVVVEGAAISGSSIFLDEGVEAAAISTEGATVLVDKGEGYAEAAEISLGDKVAVVNNTAYGKIFDNYIVTAPAYGTYETFGKPDVKWSYANGVLKIYGKGDMPAVADSGDNGYANRPWNEYANDITKIVVEEGITKIANKSFMLLSNLREVEIAATVTYVGGYVFQSCGKLDNVVFPEGVATIEPHVFHSANGVKTITLPSTVGIAATAVLNNKANTITTINVPWYGVKAIAWAENYKANNNPDVVINVSYDGKEGYLSDLDGVENAFKWEINAETGVLTVSKTDVESNGQIQIFEDHVPGKPVEILAPWFYQMKAGVITEVVIGEGITHVPGQMLRENTGYIKVTLPSTLTSAASFVFNAAKVSELYIKEGASPKAVQMINDNCDIKRIVFPSTMAPARDFIRDFSFGTRGRFPGNKFAFEFVAPYASPAYAWAQARYAEAVAQAQEKIETKDAEGNVTGVTYKDYCGISADKITIVVSYEITANADGAVTVVNNTGYPVDSVYVIVAYYDDADCTKLSALKISDAQTLADASNVVNTEAYADAAGKTVKVFLSNGLLQLRPMAAVYAE